jgi:hypothetical protein
LEDKANLAAERQDLLFAHGLTIHSHVVNKQLTVVGPFQKIKAAQKRRFTGTARPQNGHHLASLQAQIDAVQNLVPVEGFPQVFYAQLNHSHPATHLISHLISYYLALAIT